MFFIIIFVSLLFIALPFIVTEENADSILSGYNTMTKEEKENFNLKAYMEFFKKWNFFIGIFAFCASSFTFFFINKDWGLIVLMNIVLIFSTIMVFEGNRFNKTPSKKQTRIKWFSFSILISITIACNFLLWYTYQDNNFIMHDKTIEITNEYGITIQKNEILSTKLVDSIPAIKTKLHGSSMETILKGKYRTESDETIRLIINNINNKPFIEIITKNGEKIYFNSNKKKSEEIIREINFDTTFGGEN